jgi:hypothetical protein
VATQFPDVDDAGRHHDHSGMGDVTVGVANDAMALQAAGFTREPLSRLSQSVAEVKSSAKVP